MFVLIFERADWAEVSCYVVLKAKTLEQAKKHTPKAVLRFLSSDEGGCNDFGSWEELDGHVRNLRLLEVTNVHKVDPDSTEFRFLDDEASS